MMPSDPEAKEAFGRRLIEKTRLWFTEIMVLDKQQNDDERAISKRKMQIRLLLIKLFKQQRDEMDLRYSHLLQEAETLCVRISSTHEDTYAYLSKTMEDMKKILTDNISTTPSSSSANIPTPSTSSIDPMP